VHVQIENKENEGQGMTVAILGLPGGLTVTYEKLQNLVKAHVIDFFEIKGREVIFYWRGLSPKQKIFLEIEVIATIPGKYTGPASYAYLYYNDENKFWNDPITVDITPK